MIATWGSIFGLIWLIRRRKRSKAKALQASWKLLMCIQLCTETIWPCSVFNSVLYISSYCRHCRLWVTSKLAVLAGMLIATPRWIAYSAVMPGNKLPGNGSIYSLTILCRVKDCNSLLGIFQVFTSNTIKDRTCIQWIKAGIQVL